MVDKKRKPSILWLSDIHYKQFLQSDEKRVGTDDIDRIPKNEEFKRAEIKCLKKYFEELIGQIKQENYTHVLITGDLAFSGNKEQYDSLYEHFIKEILTDKDIRLITIPGNHDIDYKLMNKFVEEFIKNKTFSERREFIRGLYGADSKTKREKYKLLSNYESFFNTYIKNRLLELKNKNKIDLFCYEESNGLFGIIHDKDYNIIFNCLNSSWICIGNKNLINHIEKINEDSLDVSKRDDFNKLLDNVEHGNIIIGELTDIQSAFNDLKYSSVQECCVITCMHHPRSWLHYEHIYNDENFKWLLDVTDVFLSGHLHVPHFPPTIYRNKTYFLEAPQLLDYHLYKNADLANSLKFGYSIITINHIKNGFAIQDHSNKIDKFGEICSLSNKTLPSTYLFKRKIAQRKSILFDFTTKSCIEQFFEDKAVDHNKILLPSSDIDFNEKHCKLLRSMPEFTDVDSKKIISDSEGKYVALYGENMCFVIVFKDPNIKKNLITDFSSRINAVIDELNFDDSKPFKVKVLFYDYWVFLFNAQKVKVKDNEKEDYENKLSEEANLMHNYQLNYNRLKDFFTILRYNIFKEGETSEKNKSLDKLSLSFEIVNMERYLKFL